jgi:hypothetical protein
MQLLGQVWTVDGTIEAPLVVPSHMWHLGRETLTERTN